MSDTARFTEKERSAIASFLDALDEWGCEDNCLRAQALLTFIDGGCDLSEYKDGPKLTVIKGGLSKKFI